ncbi:MAG TPA: hypothetical protein VD885_04895 [Methylophilaceae bacterium]|nr:hypothetical protein [Methylophilaceae bacterium]
MNPMSNYRRAPVAGATYFFTLALADRRSGLLVSHIEALRLAYRRARDLHPFHTIAIASCRTQVHDWPFSSFHRYVVSGHYPEDWVAEASPSAITANSGIGIRTLRVT